MNWWQEFWKWIKDNKDALSWLFGSGVALAILGGVYKLIALIFKERRIRKTRSDENFPFKIILPNSNVTKEILGGEDNDFLADRNIPYQQRIASRIIRREIEDLLTQHQWILIRGKTGLGKTREAVNVADSLNKEGWTVLYLTRERWLSAPSKLPNGVPERKLLFVIDDLNRKIYASRVEQTPQAAENLLRPLTIPLQERLLETFKIFETLCGKNEILVIATARDEKLSDFDDEPSEWDKLEINKYNDFWKRFTFYSLPEAEDEAEINLLINATRKAGIRANSAEFPIIAKRNDGTFANLVENLRTVNNKNTLLLANTFRDTLRGTWEKRYQDAITKFHFAKYFYDAVDLARSVRLRLSFQTIFSVAKLIASGDPAKFNLPRNFLTLHHLVRTENILNPRDGQIEAKGYKVDIQAYIPKLYFQIGAEYHRKKYTFLKRFSYFYFSAPLVPKSYFFPAKRLSIWWKILANLFPVNIALNNIGNGYSELGFYEHARLLHERNLELRKWRIGRLFEGKSQAIDLNNLGNTYSDLKQTEQAIKAYSKAIELNPKYAYPWNGLGNAYRRLKQTEQAINAFKKAIELNPKYDSPWYNLGNTYSDLKQTKQAIYAFKKAIELNPKHPPSWSHLGYLYNDQKRYKRAIDSFNKAIELDPQWATPWNGLGNIYHYLKQSREAINAYNKATELDPQWATPWNSLGILYSLIDKLELAFDSFRHAAIINPEKGNYRSSMIRVLRKLGRQVEADAQANVARPLMEEESNYNRACFEAICGNIEEALQLLRNALEKNEIDVDWVWQDPDLEDLRNDPRFKKLIDELHKKEAAE